MKTKPVLLAALLCLALGLGAPALFAKDAKKPADKEKKADKPINAKCPVQDEDIDPAVTAVHKGKTVAFCCESCVDEFKKEPAKYLKIIEEQQKVEATKEGEPAEKQDGEKEEPKTEDGDKGKKEEAELNAKCPVSGDDAQPENVYKYKGQDIAFCCEECVKDFKKTPEKFVKNLEKPKGKGDKKPEKEKGGEGEESEKEGT